MARVLRVPVSPKVDFSLESFITKSTSEGFVPETENLILARSIIGHSLLLMTELIDNLYCYKLNSIRDSQHDKWFD